eukprot:scaffold290_cov364-Prasinococcus_capsulatus_cf.AAC.9
MPGESPAFSFFERDEDGQTREGGSYELLTDGTRAPARPSQRRAKCSLRRMCRHAASMRSIITLVTFLLCVAVVLLIVGGVEVEGSRQDDKDLSEQPAAAPNATGSGAPPPPSHHQPGAPPAPRPPPVPEGSGEVVTVAARSAAAGACGTDLPPLLGAIRTRAFTDLSTFVYFNNATGELLGTGSTTAANSDHSVATLKVSSSLPARHSWDRSLTGCSARRDAAAGRAAAWKMPTGAATRATAPPTRSLSRWSVPFDCAPKEQGFVADPARRFRPADARRALLSGSSTSAVEACVSAPASTPTPSSKLGRARRAFVREQAGKWGRSAR